MPNPKTLPESMPKPTREENARRDAESEQDFQADVGIPAEELFDWLHDRIDGSKAPMPKARKLF